MAPSRTLLVIGSGPGISFAVTTLFVSKRYSNVVLIARSVESLAGVKTAVEQTVGSQVTVKTYAVDVTDSAALLEALDDADAVLGKPECVFFNAVRVIFSVFFEHEVNEIEYDLKITVSALYLVAKRYMPHLVELTKADPAAKAALIVTSSALLLHPIPQLFALSLSKAAQRSPVQSLDLSYASEGVHIGVINVAGPVAREDPLRNPTNIAAKAWEWVEVGKDFEVFS